jgi:heptosyltransferase-1
VTRFSRIDPGNPKLNPRLLLLRLGAMGDVLHALPAVAMLRRALPEARIGWVVERRWRELLCAPETPLAGARSSGRPLVDELHLVDTRRWRKQLLSAQTRNEFRNVLAALRAAGYDAAIDLQGAIKSAALGWLARADLLLGSGSPREGPARWLYAVRARPVGAHVIEQNVELLEVLMEQLGLSRASSALQPGAALLPRSRPSDTAIEQRLREMGVETREERAPFAILNPGAGWGAKQWPAARYGELAVKLETLGLRSVINYGPGEEPLARAAQEASRGHAALHTGSISELIALSRRARLFVGGDTGPMHLAALLGVRTIALFGPTDPARNGPYWPCSAVLRDAASRTSYSHRRQSDAGLERISAEQVMEKIEGYGG